LLPHKAGQDFWRLGQGAHLIHILPERRIQKYSAVAAGIRGVSDSVSFSTAYEDPCSG